jgi:hypothetical protein
MEGEEVRTEPRLQDGRATNFIMKQRKLAMVRRKLKSE